MSDGIVRERRARPQAELGRGWHGKRAGTCTVLAICLCRLFVIIFPYKRV